MARAGTRPSRQIAGTPLQARQWSTGSMVGPQVVRITSAQPLGDPSRLGRRLAPSRCLFVDDTPANVHAAEPLGMAGLVYREVAELRRALEPVLA
jgi:hypothetical protein